MSLSFNPRAVLFDFDGVILDTEWPIYETWRDLFLEHGEELTLETYVQCIGSDFDTWSPETYLESLTGLNFDWKTINPARNVIIREEVGKLDAVPGIRESLAHFQRQDIPCAVVSSSDHNWVGGWLEHLGLTSYFQTIVCKGDAPKIKPAPDLYLEAVRRMNLPASDCLVIEDSLNGMKSAHLAGCPVVAIPNRITACINFDEAEFQFATMTEFTAAL